MVEQVSVIVQNKTSMKYNDLSYLTITISIGQNCERKTFLDLVSNLLFFFLYSQLNLSDLKPTFVMLCLVDRLVKVSKVVVEDVLIQVEFFFLSHRFHYPRYKGKEMRKFLLYHSWKIIFCHFKCCNQLQKWSCNLHLEITFSILIF